jgi:hypothetical protein
MVGWLAVRPERDVRIYSTRSVAVMVGWNEQM